MNHSSVQPVNQAAPDKLGLPIEPELLRQRWQHLRHAAPGLRARELAEKLAVSELQLVACRCGEDVTCLSPAWPQLIPALASLGRVMVLTRNPSCVHEKRGCFGQISLTKTMGLVLNGDIDLRLFLRHWVYAYAVAETGRAGVQHSLQIFDADGQAVHKIYATDATDMEAWLRLVSQFSAEQQLAAPRVQAVASSYRQQFDDAQMDVAAIQSAWRELRDPHQFVGLLTRFKLGRLQALRLAGPRWARQLHPGSIHDVLESAAGSGLGLMVFVGSAGVVQIHSGPVQHIQRRGPWLNVMDPDFNLHLREDQVCSSWHVRKPGPEGEVNSLELYDAEGSLIVQVFGYRKPGQPELAEWRQLIENLTALDAGVHR